MFRAASAFLLMSTVVAGALGSTRAADGDAQRAGGHTSDPGDDDLEGRQTGTDGYRKAAAYVAEQFQRAG